MTNFSIFEIQIFIQSDLTSSIGVINKSIVPNIFEGKLRHQQVV